MNKCTIIPITESLCNFGFARLPPDEQFLLFVREELFGDADIRDEMLNLLTQPTAERLEGTSMYIRDKIHDRLVDLKKAQGH
jgi:hypothetical protein